MEGWYLTQINTLDQETRQMTSSEKDPGNSLESFQLF